jgi:hypothetical protein
MSYMTGIVIVYRAGEDEEYFLQNVPPEINRTYLRISIPLKVTAAATHLVLLLINTTLPSNDSYWTHRAFNIPVHSPSSFLVSEKTANIPPP